jgi:hypothetical protein
MMRCVPLTSAQSHTVGRGEAKTTFVMRRNDER